jgi:hypothetical protein
MTRSVGGLHKKTINSVTAATPLTPLMAPQIPWSAKERPKSGSLIHKASQVRKEVPAEVYVAVRGSC